MCDPLWYHLRRIIIADAHFAVRPNTAENVAVFAAFLETGT